MVDVCGVICVRACVRVCVCLCVCAFACVRLRACVRVRACVLGEGGFKRTQPHETGTNRHVSRFTVPAGPSCTRSTGATKTSTASRAALRLPASCVLCTLHLAPSALCLLLCALCFVLCTLRLLASCVLCAWHLVCFAPCAFCFVLCALCFVLYALCLAPFVGS